MPSFNLYDQQNFDCGLLSVDKVVRAGLVKIFHPNNLGKSCGSNKQPPLSRWIFEKLTPVNRVAKFAQLAKPKSWVHKILGQ